ncbi:MAG: DNA methyltransferase [Flavobacterium sp.]|uniref:DNA methyltransferase n=1 Tax=Flavobacterium sp. TaxID=239 RepID=UPI003BDE7322
MQNLQNELVELLKHEENLVVDGHLNKNKIVELALKVEPQLISILIKNNTFKKHFFQEVENILVFDKIKFQRFVNNKSFLPDSYTAFKNKIGLITNDDDLDNFISNSNDIVLAWPHKDCVLEGGQTKEDQKRNEIFWNETLAPDSVDRLLDAKALTNFKKFDKDGEHKVTEFKGNENIIIKGNNLLTISSLLKIYRGKIKLIYIDPPYNTGGDSFKYNDSFNHATWLTFMKNRLKIAKDLLSDDGVIFVHLDYNESHYCKILLDEIFGIDKFQNEIIWRRKQATSYGNSKFGIVTDSILFYSKNNTHKFYPQYSKDDEHTQKYIKERFVYSDSDGRKYMKSPLVNSLYRPNLKYVFEGINPPDNGWLYSKEKMQQFFDNNELIIPEDEDARIYRKIYADTYKGQVIQSLWTDISIVNPMAKEQVDFSTQKPEKLLKRIIESVTDEGDYVLDFQLGSGTTAVTAHKMNRRYIGVEQMDYIETIVIDRLVKVIGNNENSKNNIQTTLDVNSKDESMEFDESGISKEVKWKGGGSFIYAELMQYNQKYIDLIQVSETKDKLIDVWNEMQDTAFLSYQFDKKTFNERLEAFKTASIEEMKEYLIEVLDKNQLYVNYSEINDDTFKVSAEDKELNKQFYSKK